MYLYFDKNGVLKEIINDEALRKGNRNINTIYAYIEDLDTNIIVSSEIDYSIADYTYTDQITGQVESVSEFPYQKDRDLKYFKEGLPYKFIKRTIPASVLAFSGLCKAGISLVLTNTTTYSVQGQILFVIEDSNVIVDSTINYSQYLDLKEQISNLVSRISVDDELSTTSEHAVQNKVITNALNNKQDVLDDTQLEAVNSGITSAKVSAYDGYEMTINAKQDTLVSGTNIKTINNTSILGSGNIEIQGGSGTNVVANPTGTATTTLNKLQVGTTIYSVASGSITIDSSLSSTSSNAVQNKVIYSALSDKQETLVSGTNIKTINNESILGSGNITISGGGTITIDSELSTESENAVQNKAIANAINNTLAVAEGKTKTYNIAYSIGVSEIKNVLTSRSGNLVYAVDSDGNETDITTAFKNGEYDDISIINASLNSQNDSVALGTNDVITSNSSYIGVESGYIFKYYTNAVFKSLIKNGDIVYIYETNVPDRWLSVSIYHSTIGEVYFSRLEGSKIVSLTESQYEALSSKDSGTLYIVSD